jgi:RimJ/RimL family protein N-acetyltransferase
VKLRKDQKIFVLDTNVPLYDYSCIFSFKDNLVVIPSTLLEEIDKLKKGNAGIFSNPGFPIKSQNRIVGYLRPISKDWIFDNNYIKLLANWREENWFAYPTVFKVTYEGTLKWVKEQLIDRIDRILFMIFTQEGNPIGHLGLSNFNFENKEAEIDNVVRGMKNVLPGIMTFSMNTLIKWCFDSDGLDLSRLYLRVFYDNSKAIELYERCGFRGIKKIPLRRIVENEIIKYEEMSGEDFSSPDKFFYLMELLKKEAIKGGE